MKSTADHQNQNQSKAAAHSQPATQFVSADQEPLVDQRPEAQLQENQLAMIQNSQQVSQLQSYQELANQGQSLVPAAQFMGKKPVVQRAMTAVAAPPTVAPLTQANLSAWILANCSASVQEFVTDDKYDLQITWDNTLAAAADTNLYLDYNGGANTVYLFAGNAAAQMDALNYPLTDWSIRIVIQVKTTAGNYADSPAGVNAHPTWQANLAHEIEVHTKIANKVKTNLEAMERRPTDIDTRKKKNSDSITLRDGDAEHANLATGGGGVYSTFKNIVLSAPTDSRMDVLLDAAWDRHNHIGHLPNDRQKLLAYRNIITWMNELKGEMTDLTAADLQRFNPALDFMKAQRDTFG